MEQLTDRAVLVTGACALILIAPLKPVVNPVAPLYI